ncbi:MAG: ATP-binding cassette domain-containing protein [Anaerolineaceae bacterium]|nr:MAG: ATP-binding cassette domain-containing protein [Anaerolineaceae bacterium]
MIRVRNLNVSYGTTLALQNVSFDVRAGECLVITGLSGCGKSTLARVLMGIIPNAISAKVDGSVTVADMDVLHSQTADVARRVGAVFQNPRSHLFHLRVDDEIAFGPRNLGLPEVEIASRVNWALEAVGLSDLRTHKPAALSGGQIQRVAIAAALAMRPDVLVLDEPTASLDVSGTQSIVHALENLKKEFGLTIILIEHRLAEVRRIADNVLVLHEGQTVAHGGFEKILSDHDFLRAYGLRRPTMESLSNWSSLLTPNGHHPEDVRPLLDMQSLSAGYDGHAIIRDINLQIFPGEFMALVGDNGTGKSTLALAAAGLLKPLTGKILVRGTSNPRPGLDIALLFQNPADQLFTDSVDEEISFGPCNYKNFQPDIHEQTLASADLQHLRARRPFSLSIGQQQRTALASCLALRPALVILDEPTLGQDWRHLQQLMDYLTHLNQQGTAILLITHDYKLVHRYARRVVLMDEGRLILDGKIDPASMNRVHAEETLHAAS